MNEDLQLKVYNWVSVTAEKIGDWTSKEVPAFITEFLTWRFWENMIGIFQYAGGMIIAIAALITLIIFSKILLKEDPKCDSIFTFISIVVPTIFIIFLGINTFAQFPTQNIKNCIQIKVAPKVYLIEEAIKIVKSSNK
jgi:hypothetical protein